jgi:ABC-type uncharacterized transport system fused permease/ATPase subunit
LAALISNEMNAIGEIIRLRTRLSEISGYTTNVSTLLERLTENQNKNNILEGDTIKFEKVNLVTPDGVVLCNDVNLEIKPNENLLVTGPNGKKIK